MIYKCRDCGYEEIRGFLPTAMPGFFHLVPAGLLTILSVALLTRNLPRTAPGWLVIGSALLLGVAGWTIVFQALRIVEWLAFRKKECSKCGRQRWSLGYTAGFGL